uniref:Thioredoxin peroxidase n=1 Tax=Caldimicrobium thiodismutans TaxID=1653476 RepID=A0A832GN50_9BACT
MNFFIPLFGSICIRPDVKAPDFEAQAHFPGGEMGPLKLFDCAGKWIMLMFYPTDFTFVCPNKIPIPWYQIWAVKLVGT